MLADRRVFLISAAAGAVLLGCAGSLGSWMKLTA
jgi:hypothetical protein